jgi:hypothetical protein
MCFIAAWKTASLSRASQQPEEKPEREGERDDREARGQTNLHLSPR